MKPGILAKYIGKDPEMKDAIVLIVRDEMPDYLPSKWMFVYAVAIGNEYWGQTEIMKKEDLEEIGNVFDVIDSIIQSLEYKKIDTQTLDEEYANSICGSL